jgi:ethanolamine utilization protein EutN/carbon dioxide concentrating mechanism protein CcmL
MLMGKVVGTVVATQKDPGLQGYKMQIVQLVDFDMKKTSNYIVVVDAIGAGYDEMVIVVQGSSARLTAQTEKKPVDAAIVGIVDSVEIEGDLRYTKFERATAGV